MDLLSKTGGFGELAGVIDRPVGSASAKSKTWKTVGGSISISPQSGQIHLNSMSTAQCPLPDDGDGSLFMISNGYWVTYKCTPGGLVKKFADADGTSGYASQGLASSQRRIVAVGPYIFTRDGGGSISRLNTDTNVWDQTLVWNNTTIPVVGGGSTSSLGLNSGAYMQAMAYDKASGKGFMRAYDASTAQAALVRFDPSTATPEICYRFPASMLNGNVGEAGMVHEGKYFIVAPVMDNSYKNCACVWMKTDGSAGNEHWLNTYGFGDASAIYSTAYDQQGYDIRQNLQPHPTESSRAVIFPSFSRKNVSSSGKRDYAAAAMGSGEFAFTQSGGVSGFITFADGTTIFHLGGCATIPAMGANGGRQFRSIYKGEVTSAAGSDMYFIRINDRYAVGLNDSTAQLYELS